MSPPPRRWAIPPRASPTSVWRRRPSTASSCPTAAAFPSTTPWARARRSAATSPPSTAAARRVVGGGVAQAASTLYLALQQVDGISYDAKKTYGSRYNQDYVESSDDAILVDESAGTDFAFTNFHGDMTIAMYISGGEVICTLELRRRLHRRGAGRGEHPRGGHAGAFRQHIAGGAGHRRHGARQAATPSPSTPSSARARRSAAISAPSTAAAWRWWAAAWRRRPAPCGWR